MKVLIALISVGLLTGCLKTRSQLKGDTGGNMRTDASGTYVAGKMGQQQRAQIDSRFFEIDRDFRELYGKIELLDKKIEDSKNQTATTSSMPAAAASDDKVKALEKRISTLEEAMLSLDKKITELSKKKDPNSASIRTPLQKAKGPYGRGEILFEQGKFEEAIASYDEYRRKFPKGRRYAQATLKMGIAFQKLKMNNDAKAFYHEVIQRYPNTRVSVRAEANLKKL